jgi:hypothetical protein
VPGQFGNQDEVRAELGVATNLRLNIERSGGPRTSGGALRSLLRVVGVASAIVAVAATIVTIFAPPASAVAVAAAKASSWALAASVVSGVGSVAIECTEENRFADGDCHKNLGALATGLVTAALTTRVEPEVRLFLNLVQVGISLYTSQP